MIDDQELRLARSRGFVLALSFCPAPRSILRTYSVLTVGTKLLRNLLLFFLFVPSLHLGLD